jgi:hypothetical protein
MILFMIMRIDWYLMMLSFKGTLEWVIKSLEKAMEVKKTNKGVEGLRWRIREGVNSSF